MISPSENASGKALGRAVAAGAHERLLGKGARGVSRLEFYPLERPGVAEVVEVVETNDEEIAPKEEVATVDVQLSPNVEQVPVGMEMARIEARAEARREWDKELEERVAVERTAILKTGEDFRRERTRYFAGVEGEVVKLALAIAARVLHREAKLDPLLLRGVVRVALEKVAEDSATVLRVPANELEAWQGVFGVDPESSLQLVADARLDAGECVLDTNVGRVELGVSAQLQEIERGFFDLIQQRPA